MIDRYLSNEMKDMFNDENRFNAYLKIELAVIEAYSEIGLIPYKDYELIKNSVKVDVKRIKEIEEITRHDVVAFTRQIGENLGEEKRWIHYGLTSTDVVDSALSLLYKSANDIILNKLLLLKEAIKDKANTYKNTPCIGRTHGMHGEVISFGVKWANYYDELNRALSLFEHSRKEIEAIKLSGAMGNYANIDPRIQDSVANKLGLSTSNIATQVLSRDRHQIYAFSLVNLASLMEKIATEIRNLSRSEILEVEEGFKKGQKGSSAMPQKRNPIASENICGCARMIRGYMLPILEDNSLYHERDISHSSVERVMLIDMIELFDYMVERTASTINNLTVFEDNMRKNIYKTNEAIFSQRVLTKLIEKGATREEAYDTIQPLAMKALQTENRFSSLLKENAYVSSYLTKEEIDECFSLEYYLKHTDLLYKRVGL